MNWDALAAIGELLGALAVLVTLIYLALQIRQNTLAVATATYESTMTGFNDIVVARHPELSSLLDRGYQGADKHREGTISDFGFSVATQAKDGGNTQ